MQHLPHINGEQDEIHSSEYVIWPSINSWHPNFKIFPLGTPYTPNCEKSTRALHFHKSKYAVTVQRYFVGFSKETAIKYDDVPAICVVWSYF